MWSYLVGFVMSCVTFGEFVMFAQLGSSLPCSSNVAFANAFCMTWPVGSCDERKCPTAASALCVIRIGELDG